MIVPLAGVLGLLLPALLGGRLRRLGGLRLRAVPVVLAGFGVQLLVVSVLDGPVAVLEAVHIGTYVTAAVAIWANRRIPGLLLLAAGAASNGVTIAVNGGTLPASAAALHAAGLDGDGGFTNSGVLADPRLPWLGDVFAVPDAVPLANVFSVGDVLIVAGATWASLRICGTRWSAPWTPPAEHAVPAVPRRLTRPAPNLVCVVAGTPRRPPHWTPGVCRMAMSVRLLGPPRVERDGVPAAPPRGRKAWALLAYLAREPRPVPRSQLADLLFADADDPLGAVRWSLAELRRALGDTALFRGDPVDVGLGDLRLDLDLLARGGDRAALLDLGAELLEGLTVSGCPAFESWLVVERHRVSGQLEARMREAAVTLLAEGAGAAAVPYAARTVALNALDEANHELLVRCLVAAGDREAALRQVEVCEALLRDELGVTPSAALRQAARTPPPGSAARVSGRAAAASQLEAGRAAVAAGAVEAGIDCLHRAVAEAARCDDARLHARALAALGGALVHAIRGGDGEGAVVLHEALRVARDAGDDVTALTVYRELGFVEVQAGRRATAGEWLDRAAALASTDEARAAVLGVQGMDASDRADYPTAIALLEESVERSARCGDARQEAWSVSILGRAHLLRGDHDRAVRAVSESLRIIDEQRWLAFQPFPRALKAELDLQAGDVASVEHDLEETWVLSCQLGDPCWEGLAARGLALLHARRDAPAEAAHWLEESLRRCGAVTDRYQWIKAYVLDTAVTVAHGAGDDAGARRTNDVLSALAARCGLRELVVRAALHRWRLGDPDALAAARMLGREIDNPVLAAELARAGTGGGAPAAATRPAPSPAPGRGVSPGRSR